MVPLDVCFPLFLFFLNKKAKQKQNNNNKNMFCFLCEVLLGLLVLKRKQEENLLLGGSPLNQA